MSRGTISKTYFDLSKDARHSASLQAEVSCSFPRFPEFPSEIRLLIWEAALPSDRIVYLEPTPILPYRWRNIYPNKAVSGCGARAFSSIKRAGSNADGWVGPYPRGFRSEAPPPILLYVCRESYDLVVQRYSKVFGSTFSEPKTWFDFKSDTLFLNCLRDVDVGEDMEILGEQDRNLVQKLAIWAGPPKYLPRHDIIEEWLRELLAAFCNLRSLAIVYCEAGYRVLQSNKAYPKLMPAQESYHKASEHLTFEGVIESCCAQRSSDLDWKVPKVSYWWLCDSTQAKYMIPEVNEGSC